ncbi:hypothetical protein CQA70_29935, partial [Klebsiella pneumoniae]
PDRRGKGTGKFKDTRQTRFQNLFTEVIQFQFRVLSPDRRGKGTGKFKDTRQTRFQNLFTEVIQFQFRV